MASKLEPKVGRIAPLGTLGKFEVKKSFRDPRGWDVILGDGTKVGKVTELIVDVDALRTRYLEVRLDKKAINFANDRNVLVPVGAARLDADKDYVVLDAMEVRQLNALPPYDRHELTREYEQAVVAGFGGTDNTTQFNPREDLFYQNRAFDDSRFVTQGEVERAVAREDDSVVKAAEEERIIAEREEERRAENP